MNHQSVKMPGIFDPGVQPGRLLNYAVVSISPAIHRHTSQSHKTYYKLRYVHIDNLTMLVKIADVFLTVSAILLALQPDKT